MPFIVADRVKETTTTTGTGSYTLAGAVANFRAFSSVCANSDTVNYAAVDNAGAGWEVGLGTWSTGGTLARTTIYASSNGGSAVNWSAGTREIFLTAAATFLASRAASGANSDITSLTGLTTALSVSQGGTGATTLTANNVLLGNGTGTLQTVAPGTSGNVLTSNGTTWVSQAGGGGGGLLGVTQSTTPFETSLGFEAGDSTTGVNNTFVGYQAGKANSTGTNNTALGHQAFDAATTGNNNTAIGTAALGALTTGSNNIALGPSVMTGVVTGNQNIGIGSSALAALTGGFNNIAIGNSSIDVLTTGSSNIGIGQNSLGALTAGASNVAIGIGALDEATTGGQNIAIGLDAMGAGVATAATGNNVAIGNAAGNAITSGTNNVAIGSGALDAATTGGRNIAIGLDAMGNGVATEVNGFNIAIGASAGFNLTSADRNVAIGAVSLFTATNAGSNVAIGDGALYTTNGGGNTAVGRESLFSVSTGIDNTALGFRAGFNITTGQNNVIIGRQAANSGTNNLTTGSNNIIIGRQAAASSATVSDEITLGNASITRFRVPGVGFNFNTTNGMVVPKTVTAAGTTGAQTINRTAGTVNFAAAATSLVVTNSFVDANSIIIATVGTNDSTMKSVAAVAGAGSFTLHANAAATAETRVNFLVIN